MAGGDAHMRGRGHHGGGRLPEVGIVDEAGAVVVGLGDDQRDRRGGPGDVPRAAPYLGQLAELIRIGDDDEIPVLAIRSRWRPPACLRDPVEVGGRHRAGLVAAHVAPGADGIPGLHGGVSPSVVRDISSQTIDMTWFAGIGARRDAFATVTGDLPRSAIIAPPASSTIPGPASLTAAGFAAEW